MKLSALVRGGDHSLLLCAAGEGGDCAVSGEVRVEVGLEPDRGDAMPALTSRSHFCRNTLRQSAERDRDAKACFKLPMPSHHAQPVCMICSIEANGILRRSYCVVTLMRIPVL